MLKILIPTCRAPGEISALRDAIARNTLTRHAIVSSCLQASAAVNRNVCLHRLRHGELAIMLDDDISGFHLGWETALLAPLQVDPSVVMVSARLMAPDGRVGQTCSRCYDLEPEEIEIQPGRDCVLPTAAIAFRYLGIFCDLAYEGSGYEDSDWCFQYLAKISGAKFIQSNRCRLIHANEMKRQRECWNANQGYFFRKWPEVPRCAFSS